MRSIMKNIFNHIIKSHAAILVNLLICLTFVGCNVILPPNKKHKATTQTTQTHHTKATQNGPTPGVPLRAD